MNFEKETVLGPDECPFCGKMVDRCSGESKPDPGDVTMCIGCGEISVFDDSLRLRKPTQDEQDEIEVDPRIRQLKTARRLIRHKTN